MRGVIGIKTLIFCADDWGFSPGINEGILELARKDLLFSVSVAANSDYIESSLEELLSYQNLKSLRFQMHFNLTYGRPLSRADQVPTLVNSEGKFYALGRFVFKMLMGQISKVEVLREYQAQVYHLKKLKIPLCGLDGHHHIHLYPLIYSSINFEFHSNEIKFIRTMNDYHHLGSYLQSLIFKTLIYKPEAGIELSSCGYLLACDLTTKDSLKKKTKKYQQLLVHPAKYNDFQKAGMTDSLQEYRLKELNSILEFLS